MPKLKHNIGEAEVHLLIVIVVVLLVVTGVYAFTHHRKYDYFHDPNHFENGYYVGPKDQTKIPYNNGFYSGPYNPNLPVINPQEKKNAK